MGQNDGEVDLIKKREPRHKVTLTKGFWLAKYETTQRQWKSVTGDNPSGFTGDDDLPVDNVTWKQCKQFAETLAERSGIRLRLPTEAEWEYACRAGTRTTFYWGNHDTTKKANFNGRIFPRDDEEVYLEKTVKTGSYEPNPWGFFDMAGNVAEWCEDDWVDEPSPENQKDPLLVNPEAIRKAIRGGAWWTPGQSCRSASRSGFWTGDASTGNGVRFAMDE
jgi:formylglycine-generating enzyme required for sulfatase activity